ncbi:antigen 5 like allergen Cul n 1 [Drosophila mauritiana]|uniref:Antigen 5 like allergen Cul n 1 n=1 Tax=Drosophila mauritiana TaxID=7226 RepID=A0A6P8KJK7_DROMA|nr:antigen 5 like allergen Cul n 1 [Drosophila mauritiana]
MSVFTVTIFVLSLVLHSLAENFCRQDLCSKGTTHIACQNVNGSFGSSCPKDATVIKLNLGDKNALTKAHNLVRQKWATGKAKIKRTACKMAKMEWNKDLEKMALLNAKTCLMRHDECHNTEKFRLSGQNLFAMGFWHTGIRKTKMNMTLSMLFEMAVQKWAGEEKDITAEDLKKTPLNPPDVIGHLTVLINEKSNAVGCGLVSYNLGEIRRYNLACNYAYTNVIGERVYEECAKAGSECPKEIDLKYPPLCAKIQ